MTRLNLDQFIVSVDGAIAEALPEQLGALSIGVICIPELARISAYVGYAHGAALLDEVEQLILQELPEVFAISQTHGTELIFATFGPARRVSLRDKPDYQARFIGETFRLLNADIFVNLRAGVCLYQSPDQAEDLLRKAHIALLQAGTGNAADIQFFENGMEDHAIQQADIVCRLNQAIEENRLELHYQPKVELSSGRMVGAEALLRWPQDDGSYISPAQFIPVAEEMGLILPLGDWVFRQASEQIAQWQTLDYQPIRISINVSSIQIYKSDLLKTLENLISEFELNPAWLELEITESTFMVGGGASVDLLSKIMEMGIELSIDDFGTGYSSLAYLQCFPVNCLKIDKSFIKNMLEKPADNSIVRCIIKIGQELGMTVLAEGAETKEHVLCLHELGCHQIQGYYYARPMPAEDISEMIKNRHIFPVPSEL